jgi:hypothetical protein
MECAERMTVNDRISGAAYEEVLNKVKRKKYGTMFPHCGCPGSCIGWLVGWLAGPGSRMLMAPHVYE